MGLYKKFAIRCMSRYWNEQAELIEKLPVAEFVPTEVQLPARLVEIELPVWGRKFSIDGYLLVPQEVVNPDSSWENINWWYVIYWFVNNQAEREYEKLHGPIHSYSFLLKDWDSRMWSFAWANRIALFLTEWSARLNGQDRESLFNSVPKASFYVTHDLDAVNKTVAIRFKQSCFHIFNVLKNLRKGKFKHSMISLVKSLKFFFSFENYWFFEKLIINRENTLITKQIVNVYGGKSGLKRSFKQMLFDPAYSANSKHVKDALLKLKESDIQLGLHQSFEVWSDPKAMLSEKTRVNEAVNDDIVTCRQHWLRFSFEKTWLAQEQCQFNEDTTLGFNDRPGFRNGAAVSFSPTNWQQTSTMNIESVPMIIMDSHLYDYQTLSETERNQEMDRWLSEIIFVGGVASIIWHPHTLGKDYGWLKGFEELLKKLEIQDVES